MNRERFIKQRRSDWKLFEQLMTRLKGTKTGRWKSDDIADLARLYRSICYDLSLVQSREWGARLERYLNDLVAQGHNCLYRSPPRSLGTAGRFLTIGFPQLLRHYKGAFAIALLLFVVPFLVSAWIGSVRPDLAELVAGKESLEAARENFGSDMYQSFDEKYAGQRSMMAGFYIRNNIGIAFQAFALGIFCGIGTAFVLLSNGISIGMVTGFIFAQGGATSTNFFSFVITHGAFELTAIVIAGAAGMVLGKGVLYPGHRTRLASLQYHGMHSLLLALGAGAMLLVAAMIEAFFSPMPIDPRIKYAVGTVAWFVVAMYLIYAGRNAPLTLLNDEADT